MSSADNGSDQVSNVETLDGAIATFKFSTGVPPHVDVVGNRGLHAVASRQEPRRLSTRPAADQVLFGHIVHGTPFLPLAAWRFCHARPQAAESLTSAARLPAGPAKR